jgi:hypothetical protein
MQAMKNSGTRHAERALRWMGAIGVAAAVAACGSGGSGGSDTAVMASSSGALRVALTDAPGCGFDHVWVSIDKVAIHADVSAAETDAGWIELAVSPAKRVDLLALTNGALEELGTTQLAAGHYSQIRLVLSSQSGSGADAAHAAQPTGGQAVALSTPSESQGGLKLQGNFDVAAGQTADVVLDFDACKSVAKAGDSGQYVLKPVVSAVPRAATAIQGFVATSMPLASTTVAAQQDGTTVRSTRPDATGRFAIPFLPAGIYTLVVSAEGHVTGVVTGIASSSTPTVINGTSTAILTPASSMAEVSGVITGTDFDTAASVAAPFTDGLVTATQLIDGGATIEVGSRPVDATLGTYRLRVPVAAAVKAAWASPATALAFTPVPAGVAQYGIDFSLRF